MLFHLVLRKVINRIVMVDLAIGDLYDLAATKLDGSTINTSSVYQCRYCPKFEISGFLLRDSSAGQAHAAAHRIAFEALLEPSSLLICPICDAPQRRDSAACIFDCMFNDLDLVTHLVSEHIDMLSEQLIGDFIEPRYLLTTFREKATEENTTQASCSSSAIQPCSQLNINKCSPRNGQMDMNEHSVEPNSYFHNHQNNNSEMTVEPEQSLFNTQDVTAVSNNEESAASESNVLPNETKPGSLISEVPATQCNDVISEGVIETNIANDSTEHAFIGDNGITQNCTVVPDTSMRLLVSRITCLACDWVATEQVNPLALRSELASHVRMHIREESEKRLKDANSFYAAKRLLCCMDFSLEEYFEKDYITDLSGAINARLMEKTYGELVVKLFGIAVPLVMRILHGNNGNPFRGDDSRVKRKMLLSSRRRSSNLNKGESSNQKASNTLMSMVNDHGETTESSDQELSEHSSDIVGMSNFAQDQQHLQCARAECGHSLLTPSDRVSLVRHIAAHIRHDELRLQREAPPVVCDCGMAVYSPMGYIYHIIHDHVYEKRCFSESAHIIISYMTLVVETAIESILANRMNCRAMRWTLWCAYLCLEGEDGDEKMFTDCTDLNERWRRLWSELVDESRPRTPLTLGDTIKLFEMYPFVDENLMLTRRRKSVAIIDLDKLHRMLSAIWRQLVNWGSDPAKRMQMASEARWRKLAEVRKKMYMERKTGLSIGNRCAEWRIENQSNLSLPSDKEFTNRGIRVEKCSTMPSTTISNTLVYELGKMSERHQRDSECQDSAENSIRNISLALNESEITNNCPSDNPNKDKLTTDTVHIDATVDISTEGEFRVENVRQFVDCRICYGTRIKASNMKSILDHCALHAVMEGRMLCSLYIHRTAEKPVVCPFCNLEMNVYKPAEFMDHVKEKHMHSANMIYSRYLQKSFPISKYFCDPFLNEENHESDIIGDYMIKCQRSSCCAIDTVLRFTREKTVAISEVDITIVKHILWHVRNDIGLDLDMTEREILTRALMVRMSASSMRQILFMAKRVTKQLYKFKEPDVVKYIQSKMDEIGLTLFGVSKGLVYQMVFPRRFVRDQSGMQLYPPCVCRLCVDKELPRFSSDRRKRAFVAYAHPVVLHVLEHLSANQLQDIRISMNDVVCRLEGLRFKNVTTAIKHVLDAHNDVVELNALDSILEEMGVLKIFNDSLSIVLGDQAWQLQEALGFGVYDAKMCPKPDFIEEVSDGLQHKIDCTRRRDPTALMCHCVDSFSSQVALMDGSEATKRKRTRTNSLRDLPLESAACYKEFLLGRGDEDRMTDHNNSDIPSSVVVNLNDVPSPSSEPTDTDSTCREINVKQESNNVRSELDSQLPVNPQETSTTTEELAATLDKIAGGKIPSKKRSVSKRTMSKKLKEMKSESSRITPQQRNKALPLKNVIQGSKTVAAAVAAALGASSAATIRKVSQQPSLMQGTGEKISSVVSKVHIGNVSAPTVPPASGNVPDGFEEEDDEESDLALGIIVKKPRTVAIPPTTSERRSRNRTRSSTNKKKTTIADLLAEME